MQTSIVERRAKDGSSRFLARVRVHRGKVVVHSESKTFERRAAAQDWLRLRDRELSRPGALEALTTADPPLGQVITEYISSLKKEAGKTKKQVLAALQRHKIAQMRCSAIKSTHILMLAADLGKEAQPQTVGNYLSHLATVFKLAKPAWGYPLDYQEIQDARVVAKHQGVVTRSNSRDRRPTLDELDRLLVHFAERERRNAQVVPMTHLIAFAIFSTRRMAEIARISFDDMNEEHSEILVRDMKHPGEKVGNDVRTYLPPQALALIPMQRARPKVKRAGGKIFPYSEDAISRAFTDACTLLGIDDLHFHDLRHEGISRLFELGWSIPRVASVSGHRTWTSLKRYTHIRQSGDKYAGWHWLQRLGIEPAAQAAS